MKLTKDQVLHIAKLARLELNEEQVKKFSNQLSDVLEYVNKLSEVDTNGVEETSQVTGLENIYKSDEVKAFGQEKQLVEQADEYEDNQIKVSKVL